MHVKNGRDLKIVNFLRKIAEDIIPINRARIAAAVVYKSEVISIGTNQKKTHPLQARFSRHVEAIHIHAEIDAIARAVRRIDAKKLAQCTLYVARIKLDSGGNTMWGMAKPCTGCERAIASFEIGRVVWTNDANTFKEQVILESY